MAEPVRASTAARLLERTPRQLVGTYVTELPVGPRTANEHEFHRLVSRGWLAGESVLTTSDGRSTSVRATAWMVEGSGMLAVFSRTDD